MKVQENQVSETGQELPKIKKIATNILVDEIAEIDNDESPNRRGMSKRDSKAFHMGF